MDFKGKRSNFQKKLVENFEHTLEELWRYQQDYKVSKKTEGCKRTICKFVLINYSNVWLL